MFQSVTAPRSSQSSGSDAIFASAKIPPMFNTAAGTDEIQEVILSERLAAITSNHT